MTATLDIITDALRESNIIMLGAVPTAPQQTEALRLLNQVVSSVYGFEVGEDLTDWPIGTLSMNEPGTEWVESIWSRPRANVRLLWDSGTAQTVWLPYDLDDGARIAVVPVQQNLDTANLTLKGNGRLIADQQDLVVATNENLMLMYRADLARWVRLDPITDVEADFVFPPEFDAAFSTMLAMRLNPRYGRAMAAESAGWLERSLRQLRARYRQRRTVAVDIGLLTQTPKGYTPFIAGGVSPRRTRGWMQ